MVLLVALFCSFFMTEQYSVGYMHHIFFTPCSADGHVGCFCVLAVVNSAEWNTGVRVSFQSLVFSGMVCLWFCQRVFDTHGKRVFILIPSDSLGNILADWAIYEPANKGKRTNTMWSHVVTVFFRWRKWVETVFKFQNRSFLHVQLEKTGLIKILFFQNTDPERTKIFLAENLK